MAVSRMDMRASQCLPRKRLGGEGRRRARQVPVLEECSCPRKHACVPAFAAEAIRAGDAASANRRSATDGRPSAVRHRRSAIDGPPSAVRHRPSAIGSPSPGTGPKPPKHRPILLWTIENFGINSVLASLGDPGTAVAGPRSTPVKATTLEER